MCRYCVPTDDHSNDTNDSHTASPYLFSPALGEQGGFVGYAPPPSIAAAIGYVAPSGDNTINALLIQPGSYGYQLVANAGTAKTIYYTFDTASSGYDMVRPGSGAVAMNTAQKTMVRDALAKIEKFADVKFVEGGRYLSPLNKAAEYSMPGAAQVKYDLSFHLFQRGYMGGTGEAVFDMNSRAADGGLINARVTVDAAKINGVDGKFLLMHELGHGLGLKHPGNYNGWDAGPTLPSNLDNTGQTLMSYNGSTRNVSDYGPLDKKALGYIYGKNGSDVRVTNGQRVTDTDFDDVYVGTTRVNAVNYTGQLGQDQITGSNFNDTLSGGEGDDRIYGGNGNDYIRGDTGFDSMEGGDGNDTLIGDNDATSDIFRGGNGNDSIVAGRGDDLVYGGEGNDLINTNAGADRIWGEGGDDTIFADVSSDTFFFGGSADVIYGGAGNDRIYGYNGADTIFGDDLAVGVGDGHDSIFAGMGNDLVYGGGGNDTIWGEDGDDRIAAGDGNDVVYGGAGNDIISSGQGLNTVDGGDGDDTISGANSTDFLKGGAGRDLINGGGSHDTIDGGHGADTLYGGAGNDKIFVGHGDIAYGDAGIDRFIVNLNDLDPLSFSSRYYTIQDFNGAGTGLGDRVQLFNISGLQNLFGQAITNASDFVALGVQSGNDTVYNFYTSSTNMYHTLVLVGSGPLGTGDVIVG